MAYVIEYGGQVSVAGKIKKQKRRRWVLAVCLLICAVTARYFFGDTIRSILIPGDDTVTLEAFSNLLSGLGEGETFSDCMTAFCREVIYGAP